MKYLVVAFLLGTQICAQTPLEQKELELKKSNKLFNKKYKIWSWWW